MKFKTWHIWVGVLVFVGAWFIGSYNSLVSTKNLVEVSWAQVENNYQSRFDLIPNLQSIVSGAANFEQETFVQVTESRNGWTNAQSREAKIQAGSQFDSALSRLLVTVEAYPALKATENFKTFQSQLEGVENRIRVARMDYNNTVGVYNRKILVFPTNLLAGMFGFTKEILFEGLSGSDVPPKIDFSN